jgi:hypothetical protein
MNTPGHTPRGHGDGFVTLVVDLTPVEMAAVGLGSWTWSSAAQHTP